MGRTNSFAKVTLVPQHALSVLTRNNKRLSCNQRKTKAEPLTPEGQETWLKSSVRMSIYKLSIFLTIQLILANFLGISLFLIGMAHIPAFPSKGKTRTAVRLSCMRAGPRKW